MITNAEFDPPNKGCHTWWVISQPALEEFVAQERQIWCMASPVTPETAEGVSGGNSAMSPTEASSSYDPFSTEENSARPSKVDRTSGSAISELNAPQCSCSPSTVTPETLDSEPTLSPTSFESDDDSDTASPTSFSSVSTMPCPEGLPPDLMPSNALGWIYAPRAAPEVADARMSAAEPSPTVFSPADLSPVASVPTVFSPADLSPVASVENPGDETSDSAGKHKRALEDGRMAKTPCSKTDIRCPCEETSGSEIQDAYIKGEDQRVGFWVLLNQAPDLIWPENHEGPFDKAWRLSSSTSWIYGRIGKRAKGMPFAVVKTTWVPEAMSSQAFMYRRYYKG